MVTIGAHRDDKTVSKIKVSCKSKSATGTAATGKTDDGGKTILAKVAWKSTVTKDLLDLLQEECDFEGELAGKPLKAKYKIIGIKGGTETRFQKK
jgi:hypothetical protein